MFHEWRDRSLVQGFRGWGAGFRVGVVRFRVKELRFGVCG